MPKIHTPLTKENITQPANNGYLTCFSCQTFLTHERQVQYMQPRHVCALLQDRKRVGVPQHNYIFQIYEQTIHANKKKLIPFCRRCYNNKLSSLIYDVVHYFGSGGEALCPDKRSVMPVVYALAKRIVLPDGSFKYNSFITNPSCPNTMQDIVAWMHRRAGPLGFLHKIPAKFVNFDPVARQLYWVAQGCYIWRTSRNNTRPVRSFIRRNKIRILNRSVPAILIKENNSKIQLDSSAPNSILDVSAL